MAYERECLPAKARRRRRQAGSAARPTSGKSTDPCANVSTIARSAVGEVPLIGLYG